MRLGIELSPTACRLVEVEGRLRPGVQGGPRVRSFAVLPPSGVDTDAMFASLKGRDAAVLVWGTPSEHRQVVVTRGSYEAMRREAVAALASVGMQTHAALADIAPVRGASGPRVPVVAAIAAAEPMLDAIRPLQAAGIRVRSLATPAMALASLAVTRRGIAEPAPIEAYVAIEETATCIALMRDGALAIARELPWGYVANGALRARDDIAQRLAIELEQYLDAVGAPSASQVCVCGGLPELRSMAATLTDRLDVEVEPLDSLFGIDEAHLPEPADGFRERVAELRPAWAVAVDWPPHLSLMRARRREQSRRALAAAAIVAGIAAGVGGAWRIARSDVWPAPRHASASRVTESSPTRTRAGTESSPTRTRVGTESSPSPRRPPLTPPPLSARSTVPRASMTATLVRPPLPALTPTLVAELRQPPPAPAAAPPVVAPKPSVPTALAAAPKPSAPPPASPLATRTLSTPPAVAKAEPRPAPPPATRSVTPPPVLQRPITPPPVLQRPAVTPAPTPSTAAARPTTSAATPPRPATTPSTPATRPTAPAAGPPASATRPSTLTPPAAAPRTSPPAPAAAPPASATRPSTLTPPATAPRTSPPPPAARTQAPAAPPTAPPPVRTRPRPTPLASAEPILPFDASLETILYSPDRKLAIIDGRIVGVGDLVRGARIVEITPTAVMLRDANGRLRRLTLGAGRQ